MTVELEEIIAEKLESLDFEVYRSYGQKTKLNSIDYHRLTFHYDGGHQQIIIFDANYIYYKPFTCEFNLNGQIVNWWTADYHCFEIDKFIEFVLTCNNIT